MAAVTTPPAFRRSLAGILLRARESILEPLRPVMRQAGVTEQQWRVLRVLAGEGEMAISDIGRAALLHGASVTRILRQLEERRLIRRRGDAEDGRRFMVAISAPGEALVAGVWAQTSVILASYADRFGADRLRALVAEVDALVAMLDGAQEDGKAPT